MKWTLQKRSLADLSQHPKNARLLSEHDFNHLDKSIKKFGCIEKPVVNADNMIIGGHQRVIVLVANKEKEIMCWVPDRQLDPDEVDELNIRLNRNTGDWDWDKLGNEWDADNLLEWGFEEDEIYNEKKKGSKPQKPTLSIQFDSKDGFESFINDIKVNLNDLKEAAEFYRGKVRVKGLDGI